MKSSLETGKNSCWNAAAKLGKHLFLAVHTPHIREQRSDKRHRSWQGQEVRSSVTVHLHPVQALLQQWGALMLRKCWQKGKSETTLFSKLPHSEQEHPVDITLLIHCPKNIKWIWQKGLSMTVHSGFTPSDSPSREPKSEQLRLNSPSLPSTERWNAFPDFSTGTKKVFTRSQWSICWVENVLPNWKVHDSHVLSTTATHMSQAYGCFPKTLSSWCLAYPSSKGF